MARNTLQSTASTVRALHTLAAHVLCMPRGRRATAEGSRTDGTATHPLALERSAGCLALE